MKQSWWHQRLSRIKQVTDLPELHRLCRGICRQLKTDHFLVLAGQLSNPEHAGLSALSGLPDDWWQQVKQPKYFQSDPTLRHTLRSHLPLFWSELDAGTDAAGQGWNFPHDALEHGLAAGLSIPVHGPAGLFGVLSLANRTDHPQAQRNLQLALPKACLVAGYLVSALLRCNGQPSGESPSVALTGREKDCLLWAAKGKTSWEISNILRIGERTVIYHLNNVLRKLGSANRQQAVASACAQGLLPPELKLETFEALPMGEQESPCG